MPFTYKICTRSKNPWDQRSGFTSEKLDIIASGILSLLIFFLSNWNSGMRIF